MSGDAFLQSLVTKCSPVPWHQAIFLSQKIINDSFSNMWNIAKEDKNDPIRYFKLKTMVGEMDTKLLAPTVIVNVENDQYTLYLQWNFESGKMRLSESFSDKGPFKEFDVAGWVVAFGSTFKREVFSQDSPEYQHFKQKMQVPAQSNFSIAQLYLKSLESPTYYEPGSDFKGVDWDKQPGQVKTNFLYLRLAWMDEMQRRGHTRVAIVGTTDKPDTVNPEAPTFPPTSIDYLTYPWIDPKTPNLPSNKSDANALSYLMMTGGNKAPIPPRITYTGTWVSTQSSDPGRDALLCMSAEQFWDQWFLPALQVANKAIQMQPTKPLIETDGVNANFGIRFVSGTCTKHPNANDTYYQWKKSPEKKNEWTWNADPALLKSSASDSNWFNYIKMEEEAWAWGNAWYDEGKRTMTVTNGSKFWAKVRVGKDINKGDATMEWNLSSEMKFEVARIDDGGLQLQPVGSPAVSRTKPWKDSYLIRWSSEAEQYVIDSSDRALVDFKAQQNAYHAKILAGLNRENKLILPGSGEYLCSNVMFNARGDLLTNLAFNGADPPGEPRKIPECLVGLGPRRTAAEFANPPAGPPPAPKNSSISLEDLERKESASK